VFSLQQFVADAGQYSVRMVDNLLDILTNGEHSKANATIIQVSGLNETDFLTNSTVTFVLDL
jgi:hypothetical protein